MVETGGGEELKARRRLGWLTLATQAALVLERLIVLAAPAVAVAMGFVAFAWSGLFLAAPAPVRLGGAAAFALGLVAAARLLLRFRPVSAAQARQCLDSGHEGGPAATLADALANPEREQTGALWRAHRLRAQKGLEKLRPPAPAPKLAAQDPYGLVALAILAMLASGFVAGPEKSLRLAAAFDWRGLSAPGAAVRVDAWIDPPRYTGKPPLVLSFKGGGAQRIDAPIGSLVVARASDPQALNISTSGALEVAPATKDGEQRLLLRGDGRLRFSGAASGDFALHAIPDQPPKIAVVGDVKINARGSFSLAYRIDDDYGARDAKIAAVARQSGGRALFPPPEAPLELPAAPGGLGEAKATLDWSDSPYAGQRLDLRLSVRDEAAQQGEAAVKDFVLPQKLMRNPLALALAEQRRILALDADRRGDVQAALEALDFAPDLFTPKLSVHLGLRFAVTALRRARDDAQLREVADFLWAMALQIEDGDMSQAERELRAAEKALREAIKNGAPKEEIDRLTAQLRKAMEKFLAEMAKKAQHREAQSQSGEGQAVSPEDFQKLLEQMKKALEEGDTEKAQALLDQMQSMLENLQNAESGASRKQENRQSRRDLDKMMREQQQLRDETSERERGGRQSEPGEGQPRAKGQPGQSQAGQGQASELLEQRQGQLQQKLDALRRGAPSMDSKAAEALKQAEGAMQDAEKALKQGDDGKALDAQQQALDQMGRGAGEMAKSEKEDGEESQEAGGQKRGGRDKNGEGPFDNAQHSDGVQATAAQKARKILDELRKRLADPSRAQQELDYLERLIRPN